MRYGIYVRVDGLWGRLGLITRTSVLGLTVARIRLGGLLGIVTPLRRGPWQPDERYEPGSVIEG